MVEFYSSTPFVLHLHFVLQYNGVARMVSIFRFAPD